MWSWYVPWGGPKPPATGNMKLQEENKSTWNSVTSVQMENPPWLPHQHHHQEPPTFWSALAAAPAGPTEPNPSKEKEKVIPQWDPKAARQCRARKHRADPPCSPDTALTHPHHPQETFSTHTAWEQVSVLCGLSMEWINISSWKYLTQQDHQRTILSCLGTAFLKKKKPSTKPHHFLPPLETSQNNGVSIFSVI